MDVDPLRTWDAIGVRALREQLGLTQAELAERLGTRQQTVSEWETGVSRPRRMSQRLLGIVAEESAGYEAGAVLPGTDVDPSVTGDAR